MQIDGCKWVDIDDANSALLHQEDVIAALCRNTYGEWVVYMRDHIPTLVPDREKAKECVKRRILAEAGQEGQ